MMDYIIRSRGMIGTRQSTYIVGDDDNGTGRLVNKAARYCVSKYNIRVYDNIYMYIAYVADGVQSYGMKASYIRTGWWRG